jgi:hypothetical protein
MTTTKQKEGEERYVKAFLDGLVDYTSLEQGERPDFSVYRGEVPVIALEVTEYHPEAEGLAGIRRAAVEARWWLQLEPLLDRMRRKSPALRGVQVLLQFNTPEVPKKSYHAAFASEFVRLVETVANQAQVREAEVEFAPRATVAQLGSNWGDSVFMPAEEWPQASRHLSTLRVTRWPIDVWPPWQCLNVAAAWLGPSLEEFRRILDGKAEKAQGYDLRGAPLWLLIVTEVVGDLQSHIFPANEFELDQLLTTLRASGFDFENGPFREVWLVSAFGGGRLRLHPLATSPPLHEEVAVAAYYIWEHEGRPHGRDKEHWYRALAQLHGAVNSP